ncbi:glyceronephosphate O-acyltransferase [Entomortierella parvispora]|uniref:Glyceronephosphate O-acyltransferase n=1 Tax=Entomortierella parvispora TaxID=205924 RepID=A0A9P3H4R2_9FUNG|nr:glyceronephosphate O-acyltransferase [Entomortierella parvispora]
MASSNNNSNNNNNTQQGNEPEHIPTSTPVAAPVLELKPLKNVMPIVPAQQVDSSSCPASGETSPATPSSPAGEHVATHNHVVDNDEAGVENITKKHAGRIREDPVGFVVQTAAFYQGTGWRSYSNYVGTRIFYEGFSATFKERILASEKVNELVKTMANKQLEVLIRQRQEAHDAEMAANAGKKNYKPKARPMRPEDIEARRKTLEAELVAVAKTNIDKLVCDMNSMKFIRFFAFLINNILVRMYHQGIHIKESEFLELRRVAEYCAEKKYSMVVLPCHKSHIDYLVISYIFFRMGLALPHIAAGDNLDMPIVGKALKGAGAFFIRRSWADDQLYTSIVQEYVQELLEGGYNIECFIEGTRSRTGKLLPPKLGVLKIVMDAMLSNRVQDCYIVPISIGYDKVIETETYINELLGIPKEKESLWGVITNSRLLQLKMGRIDVRFAKPYSLRNFMNQEIERREIVNELEKTNSEAKSQLLKALGYKVLADINSVSVVMPTALVGTVILTLRGRGVGRNELIRRVDWLKREILAKGGRVANFSGMETGVVVDRALGVLKDLVALQKNLLEPVFYAVKRFELSFYRNQLIHLFVHEAIVAVTLYTRVKIGGAKSTQFISHDDLLREVTFMSRLLKTDFIYNPGDIQSNLVHTLEYLKKANVIEIDSEGNVGLSDAERAIGRENYDFYCFLLWPFVETYWLAAVSLYTLIPNAKDLPLQVDANGEPQLNWIEERVFMEKTQMFGKTLYYQGDLSYFESVNMETLKNGFNRLSDYGILMIKKPTNAKERTKVALHPDFIPVRGADGHVIPNGALWDMVEHIGTFRREGKNRRDNATVSSRVLRFAEVVANSPAPKRTLSRARPSSMAGPGDSTDEESGHTYHDNEMTRTEERANARREQKKYAKITSTRRAVLTMGLTLLSVVAVMGIVGCQASKLLRRR